MQYSCPLTVRFIFRKFLGTLEKNCPGQKRIRYSPYTSKIHVTCGLNIANCTVSDICTFISSFMRTVLT